MRPASMFITLTCAAILAGSEISLSNLSEAADSNFSSAVIVVSPVADSVERKAAAMLAEEVEKRCGLLWSTTTSMPPSDTPAIFLGSVERIPPGAHQGIEVARGRDSHLKQDGYVLVSRSEKPERIYAIGNDSRGCLFAAGRLLRELRMKPGSARIPPLDITTAPHRPIRGHQIGWRPKSNTYDRWGLKEYEQYVRDLIVWGTNAIELIPLDPDGDFDESLRFNARLAEMIASYGLEVWLWYPFDDRIPASIRGVKQKPGDNACPSEADERRFLLDRRR